MTHCNVPMSIENMLKIEGLKELKGQMKQYTTRTQIPIWGINIAMWNVKYENPIVYKLII